MPRSNKSDKTIFSTVALFFSHILHPGNCCFSSPYPSSHFSAQINSSVFLTKQNKQQKQTNLPGISTYHGLTNCNKMRHRPSYQGWKRQSNRRKGVPSTGKRVRDPATHNTYCWNPIKTSNYTTIGISRGPRSDPCRSPDCGSSLCEPL